MELDIYHYFKNNPSDTDLLLAAYMAVKPYSPDVAKKISRMAHFLIKLDEWSEDLYNMTQAEEKRKEVEKDVEHRIKTEVDKYKKDHDSDQLGTDA